MIFIKTRVSFEKSIKKNPPTFTGKRIKLFKFNNN
nr:MAG TPA: hypothetical protein [Crassvirales sp.]